jgi:hypothetical protein
VLGWQSATCSEALRPSRIIACPPRRSLAHGDALGLNPRLIAVVSGWPTFCTQTCAGLPPYRTISVVQAKRNCARTVGT